MPRLRPTALSLNAVLATAALAACVSSVRTMSAGSTVYALPSPMTCAAARAEAMEFRLTRGADSTRFVGEHASGTTLEVRMDTLTRELKSTASERVRGEGADGVPLATRVVGEIGRACGIVTAGVPR